MSDSSQTGAPSEGGTSAPPAGWHPDPAGRFEHRYWDGTRWTSHVSRGGSTQTDAPPIGAWEPPRAPALRPGGSGYGNPVQKFAVEHHVAFGAMFAALGVVLLAIAISSEAGFALIVSVVFVIIGIVIMAGRGLPSADKSER